MKHKNAFYLPVLFSGLLVLSVILYQNVISLFPSFVHAWTQSERYAIALQFLSNGFDFFHPATFNQQTVNGITRIDFPINEFIVAIMMKTLGSTAPVIFRCYTFVVSMTGLLFLFLLSRKITHSPLKSAFMVVFVFLCPVYSYYQIGFLPSIPAVSFIFIAVYYSLSYNDTKQTSYFIISLLFFLLAALIRLPFVIFLCAAFLQECWVCWKEKRTCKKVIVSFVLAFAIFAGYYFYNVHLSRVYGNVFLDHFTPAKSKSEFFDTLCEIYKRWLPHYFTWWHYGFMILLSLLCIVFFNKKKKTIQEMKKYTVGFIGISIATILYFILMQRQYLAHDYYFLDSFFVPVILLCVFLMRHVPIHSFKQKIYFGILFLAFTFFSFKTNMEIQASRYETGPWDRVEITHQNFRGTEAYLDSLGISKNAKILVIDAYSTNIPLILMNRKGYTVMLTSRDMISTALFFCKWDYVAIQETYLVSDIIQNYPIITSLLEKIGGTGKVSFYQWSKTKKSKSLKEFLGITPAYTLYSKLITFNDTLAISNFSGLNHTLGANAVHNSPFAVLDSTTEYGATFTIKAHEFKNRSNLKALVTIRVLCEKKIEGLELVNSISNSQETICYQTFGFSSYMKPSSAWKTLTFQFILPPFKTPDDELKIYLHNPSGSILYYDDLEVLVYN